MGAAAGHRRLDPRPGGRFGAQEARYVVPDVIVKKMRDRWVALINPASLPRVRLNRAYADAIQNKSASNQSLSRHLQEARWLLRSIEQRFATIQRVADAIVARQRGFFEYGEVAMKPLTLKLIAGELGLHESTVCRVTNNKYMATPRGLFEFKHFFSRRLATENGGAASATAVRRRGSARAAFGCRARAPPGATGAARRAQNHHQIPCADASTERGCKTRRSKEDRLMSRIVGGRFDRSVDADAFYVGPPG